MKTEVRTAMPDILNKILAQLHTDLIANSKRCKQVVKQYYPGNVTSWKYDRCIIPFHKPFKGN